MTNPKSAAFPRPSSIGKSYIDGSDVQSDSQEGLTKREYFAGLAMQGNTSVSEALKKLEDPAKVLPFLASFSVMFADALIAELNK